eukprot:scaffold134990_cov36-Tisochrysis_lutea.AAC.1
MAGTCDLVDGARARMIGPCSAAALASIAAARVSLAMVAARRQRMWVRPMGTTSAVIRYQARYEV